MKTLIATAAILVATSTASFAGPKAANLVAPVNETIETLETQVETLAFAATSLAIQLRDALDADTNAADHDYIADLEDEVEDLEAALNFADEDYADLEDELNTSKNNHWVTKQNVIRITEEAKEEEDRLRGLVFEARDERDDLQLELDAVYEDLETAYDDMDDLDEEILELKEAIAGIAQVANENAATQVLSFISSLDLEV